MDVKEKLHREVGDKRIYSLLSSLTQARTQGGVHWVHVHPSSPHLGKKFRSAKRGEKVPPRYVGKKKCARFTQIRQNENEKGSENKKIVKRKG